jgi:hypothetical protein
VRGVVRPARQVEAAEIGLFERCNHVSARQQIRVMAGAAVARGCLGVDESMNACFGSLTFLGAPMAKNGILFS